MKAAEEYFYEGNKLYKQKKYDEAIICYEKSIDIVPKENTYIRLAVAYKEKKCLYKSLESFQKALKLNPNSTYAYISIGNLYSDNGYYEESIEYYNKTIELIKKQHIYDNLTNVYYNRGLSYYHLRFYNNAEKDLLTVIKLKYYQAYNDLGNIYLRTNRYEKAEICYKNAIKYSNKNEQDVISNSYNGLGVLYRIRKLYNKSNYYLKKCLNKYNNNYIYLNIGINYRILKKYHKSKKYYNLILKNKNYISFSYKLYYSIYRLYNDGGINVEEYNLITSKIIKEILSNQDEYIEIINRNYKLYNYTKINKNTIKTILNNEIWLSSPDSFNDPIDPPIKQLNENNNNKFKYLINSIVIGCLSLTNDNSLMWSHYADKHEGICIEYDFKNFFINKPENIVLKKINYVKEIISENDSILTSKSDDQDNLMDILATKSIEWKYENEYRIIKYKNEDEKNTLNVAIKNIYFGAKTSQTDKQLLIKILKNTNIVFYESSFDKTQLNKIVFTKINT